MASINSERECLQLVGADEMSPARMFRLLKFESYAPVLSIPVFVNLQFINDLARNYCKKRRPIQFWDFGEDLAKDLQEINNARPFGTPKLIVGERLVQEDFRYTEYYLKFAVEFLHSNHHHVDLEMLPLSLQRAYLVPNQTATRAVLPKFPEESYRRIGRAFSIIAGEMSPQQLLATTRDRYGNLRLQYMGLLYHRLVRDTYNNAWNKGILFHQSTFLMKGVLLELYEDELERDSSTYCLCPDCCHNRIFTISAHADRIYSIFEYQMSTALNL